MNRPRIKVSVTRKELRAIIIGLHEYLYIVEEGNLPEALREMDANFREPASASQTSDLLGRLGAALE